MTDAALAAQLRYSRQAIADVRGEFIDQDRIRGGRVAVIGGGALGSNVVMTGASAGISMDVYDFDVVGPETLGRSVAFLPEDIGRPKAEALAERATALNPGVTVRGIVAEARLTVGGARWEDYDVLLLMTDSVRSRADLARLALRLPKGPRWVVESGLRGFDWHVQVMSDATHCYSCGITSAGELEAAQSCNGIQLDVHGRFMPSTLTAAVSAAGVVVQETLLALSGRDPVFAGRSVRAAMTPGTVSVLRMPRRGSCPHHPRWREDELLRVPVHPDTTVDDARALIATHLDVPPARVSLAMPRALVHGAVCVRCDSRMAGGMYVDLLRAPLCHICGRPVTATAGCSCGAEAPPPPATPFQRLECPGCGSLDPNAMVIDDSTILTDGGRRLREVGIPARELLTAYADDRMLPVILEEVHRAE